MDHSEGYAGIWLKPVDARRYAWTRVVFALVIICQMLHLWQYREGLFGNNGIFPADVAKAHNPGFHFPSIIMADLSWWPGLMIICGLLSACLLFWGKWQRVALIAIFLILLTFAQRAPLATTGWDFVLTNFTFILIFSPLGKNWTPPKLWASRKNERLGRLESDLLPRYGLVLIQVQVAVIYWQTVIERAGDRFWGKGEFMSYYLLSHHSRFAGLWVIEWDGMLVLATYLTSLLEIAIPILLWIKGTRWIGLTLGIMFHLSIGFVSLNIGLFSLTMIMSYVAFLGGLPSDDWQDD
ncbi:MAG: HTTM domain-containing protein [Akkermansiaceae bacterium]